MARLATATASSAATGQSADRAIDGLALGYPKNSSAEWATKSQTTGAWLTLTWPAYYMVDSLIFYDRPNSNDWITGGKVDFSDGSSVKVPSLNNDGSATIVNLTKAVNISSLKFTVTSAGSSSGSVGLAEIVAAYSLYVLSSDLLLGLALTLQPSQSSNAGQHHPDSVVHRQQRHRYQQLDFSYPLRGFGHVG